MLTVALAAVLAVPAAPFSGAAWADGDDGKNGKKVKVRDWLATFIKELKDDGKEAAAKAGSFSTVKISAKGLALEKGGGAVKTSDATLALTGSVFKNSGNHAKVFVNGTLDLEATGTWCSPRATFGSATGSTLAKSAYTARFSRKTKGKTMRSTQGP